MTFLSPGGVYPGLTLSWVSPVGRFRTRTRKRRSETGDNPSSSSTLPVEESKSFVDEETRRPDGPYQPVQCVTFSRGTATLFT